MIQLLIFGMILATSLARPQQPNPSYRDATITNYQNDNSGLGPYRFAYETSDGQSRQEQGEIVNPGTDNEALVVKGSYSYLGPDGVRYTVNYVADKEGFKPEGAHIPNRRTPSVGLPAGVLGSLVGGGLG